jgi:hypothetical protein
LARSLLIAYSTNLNKPKYMNKIKYLTAILIAVAGLGLQQAQAHLLPGQQFGHMPFMGGTDEASYLIANGYVPATSQYLGKFESNANGGGVENGAINISQYVTVTQTTTTTWTISWNLAGSGFTLDGVLIKDGTSGVHGQSIYEFFAVSADEKVSGSGTVAFDGQFTGKNISHISFFGSPGGQVPDGGTTVMLLGAALSTLGVARRYLKS